MDRSGRERRWRLRLMLLAAASLGVAGCASPASFLWGPEVPESRHPGVTEETYPNINEAPDRPSEIKSTAHQRQIEMQLRQLGKDHVDGATTAIETTGRRS